jgi:NTE family protein
MKNHRFIFLFIATWMLSSVMIARPKIGLVLGGGGAKGAAEVGVLKVLEEVGVKHDYIVGTSIGSIVGGLYAAGYTATELETMFKTQEWLSLLTDRDADLSNEPYTTKNGITYIFGFPIIDSKNSRGVGMIKGERIEHVLDSMLKEKGVKLIERLKIPFCCVAADIHNAEEVVLSKGSVASAMRASMAIPGIFKPVKKGDCLLVDGGMLNNLPVDVCKSMGADIIIAVDLQQNEQKPKEKKDFSILTGIGNMFGLGGIIEWITTRPDIDKYMENKANVDVYIHPDIQGLDAASFGNKNSAKMIKAGEDAARNQWEKLLTIK